MSSSASNSNMPMTPSPPPGILQGVCGDSNGYFWLYFGSSVFFSILIIWCSYLLGATPKRQRSSSGSIKIINTKPNYGKPLEFTRLMLHMCLWSVAPQTALFIIYHVVSTHLFHGQEAAACIVVGTVPFFAYVLLVIIAITLVLYDSNWIVKYIGPVVTSISDDVDVGNINNEPVDAQEDASAAVATSVRPDDDAQPKKLKVLFLGCTNNGALFLDALDKERRGVSEHNTESYCVNYSQNDASIIARVQYNADCLGIDASLVAPHRQSGEGVSNRLYQSCSSGPSLSQPGGGVNPFLMPFFADASFDRVVVSPNVRNSYPIGDFMTEEPIKAACMVMVLQEAMRVLRPQGEIFAYDNGANIVWLQADLRDCGYRATIVESGGQHAGPMRILLPLMYKLHCPHQQANYQQFEEAAAAAAGVSIIKEHKLEVADIDGCSNTTALLGASVRQYDTNATVVTITNAASTKTTTTTSAQQEHHDASNRTLLRCETRSSTRSSSDNPHHHLAAGFEDDSHSAEHHDHAVASTSRTEDDVGNNAFHSTTTSSFQLMVAMGLLQSVIFVALLFGSIALFERLSVPRSIPLSTRINTLVINTVLSYPMMAYLTRTQLFSSHAPPTTYLEVLRVACTYTEPLALLVTVIFIAVMGVPGLVIQLALVGSSTSVNTLSMLGIVISIIAGMIVGKLYMSLDRKAKIRQRKIADDVADMV